MLGFVIFIKLHKRDIGILWKNKLNNWGKYNKANKVNKSNKANKPQYMTQMKMIENENTISLVYSFA